MFCIQSNAPLVDNARFCSQCSTPAPKAITHDKPTKGISRYAPQNAQGLCYAMLERYQEAIQDFNAVIELKPREPVVYRNRAVSWAALGLDNLPDADRVKSKQLENHV